MRRRLALVTLLLACATAPAQAGDYVVQQCGEGGSDGWTGWATDASMDADAGDCAVGAPAAPFSDGSAFRMTLSAPPDTRIAAYRLDREAAATETGKGSWVHTRAHDGSELEVCTACGPVEWAGAPVAAVELKTTCTGGKCDGPASIRVSGGTVTLRDELAPAVAAAGALFTDGAALGEHATGTFTATDRGGGVYGARLVIDGAEVAGGVVDENGGHCRMPFRRMVPCKPEVAGRFDDVDLSALPPGEHTVTLLVADAAGNEAAFGPVTIRTGPVAPAAPTAAAAPVRAIDALVIGQFTTGVRTRVRQLVVRRVPAGGRVELRCRGRRCPFSLRTRRPRRGTVSLSRLLRRHPLPAGTVLEVRVLAPGRVGKVVRYGMRLRASPRRTTRCLPPGAPEPVGCSR